jgi:hypothetical protein
MTTSTQDPFGGALEVVPAHQIERYIAEVRAQMHKAKSPATDIDATGLECLEDSPEKVFLRANPSLKAAVDAGRMSVCIDRGKTTIALAGRGSGRLAKLYIPIDLENGSHLEDFAKLEAQLKLIQEHIEKHPLLKEALEDGRAEIRMDHGNLGIHTL